MRAPNSRRMSWVLAAGLMLAACGPQEQPAPPPTPAPTPEPPKVTSTAFAMPILESKLETWKAFLAEVSGPLKGEWDASRAAAGLTREAVWLQKTPEANVAVVYQEATDAAKVMPNLASSEEAMAKNFIAMVREVHGVDLTGESPLLNEVAVRYEGDGTRNPVYGFAVPIVEGKEAAAKEWQEAVAGPRAAEFAESRVRVGATRETVWSQAAGNLFVVVWESPELESVMSKHGSSEHPFEQWFVGQVGEWSGIDFRAAAPPPNELMFDWKAPE